MCPEQAIPPTNLCYKCRLDITKLKEENKLAASGVRCISCNHNQSVKTDPDGLCRNCRNGVITSHVKKQEELQKKIDAVKRRKRQEHRDKVREEVTKRTGGVESSKFQWKHTPSYGSFHNSDEYYENRYDSLDYDSDDDDSITDVAVLHEIITNLKKVVKHMDDRLDRLEALAHHQLKDVERQVEEQMPLLE
jgi:hypothetical protein